VWSRLPSPELNAAQRAVRLTWAAIFVVVGIAGWMIRLPFRGGEATASAWLADRLLDVPVFAYPAEARVFVGRPVQLGFEITPECSALIVLLAFLLGSTLLALFAPRFRLQRILSAFALSCVLIVVVNVLRVVVIVVASSEWGHDAGYVFSHEAAGSTMTVFGVALALLVYLWVLARDRSPVGEP
jgi:exosortase/archaeosortase family protein